MELRELLGLPPDTPDDVVQQKFAELKARALENVDCPDGWMAVAEGVDAIVFTSYLKGPAGAKLLADIAGDFSDVEFFQVKYRHDQGDYELSVRRAKTPLKPPPPKKSKAKT